jgi:hypothetical protein
VDLIIQTYKLFFSHFFKETSCSQKPRVFLKAKTLYTTT